MKELKEELEEKLSGHKDKVRAEGEEPAESSSKLLPVPLKQEITEALDIPSISSYKSDEDRNMSRMRIKVRRGLAIIWGMWGGIYISFKLFSLPIAIRDSYVYRDGSCIILVANPGKVEVGTGAVQPRPNPPSIETWRSP